jgi:hypothetical protein
MRYTVKPETVEGCDCEDCKAGKHLYSLFRWTGRYWDWAATSLQPYTNAGECKRKHRWGIDFGVNAAWEDGEPVVEPQPERPAHADKVTGGRVPLDMVAFAKSAELLVRHWGVRGK